MTELEKAAKFLLKRLDELEKNNSISESCKVGYMLAITDIRKLSERENAIPYTSIIGYLNQVVGTKYREIKSTKSKISARWQEGHTEEDFKIVIDKKSKEWLGTDQAKYLRPETLFAADHFESYLNQIECKAIATKKSNIDDFYRGKNGN
jgi:uncharacterized phage protein (TIGR02220 family)